MSSTTAAAASSASAVISGGAAAAAQSDSSTAAALGQKDKQPSFDVVGSDSAASDAEFVDVIVDADGQPIHFDNEQDETNVLMMLDFQEFLAAQEKAAAGPSQQRQKINDGDDQHDAARDGLEHFRVASSEPALVVSAHTLDWTAIFKNLNRRSALRDAGEMDDEDAAIIAKLEQQQREEEAEEQENLRQIEAQERAAVVAAEAAAASASGQGNAGGGDAEEEEYADEAGMAQSLMSREHSDFQREETDREEWNLGRIIARKMVDVEDACHDDDADLYEDDDIADVRGRSVQTRRKRKRREHAYQCVWQRGYTTWELKSTLAECGYAAATAQFDAELAAKAVTARSARTTFRAPSQFSPFAGHKTFVRGTAFKREAGPGFVPLSPEQKFFEDAFPNIATVVATKFRGCGMQIPDRIVNIAPTAAARKFITQHSGTRSLNMSLLFHGSPAVPGILANGLVVPGASGTVRVTTGQAYNPADVPFAIYTAGQPQTSTAYCKGQNVMFVCVGVPEQRLVFGGGSVVIFPDAADVVPVWLVRWQGVAQAVQSPHRFYTLHEFNHMRLAGDSDVPLPNVVATSRPADDPELHGLPAGVKKKVLRLRRRQLEYKEGRR